MGTGEFLAPHPGEGVELQDRPVLARIKKNLYYIVHVLPARIKRTSVTTNNNKTK